MPKNAPHKQAALSFLDMVTHGQIHEAYQIYVRPDMKHHNVYFPGDAASLEKGMEENDSTFPNKLFDVMHAFEEGEFVVTHSHVRLEPGGADLAAVHIFRFEGEKIAEMWDIVQTAPAETPNKNGMF